MSKVALFIRIEHVYRVCAGNPNEVLFVHLDDTYQALATREGFAAWVMTQI